MEVLRCGEGLAQEGRAHHLAVPEDQGAVGLVLEAQLGDDGDGQRVQDPGEDGEDEDGPQAGQELDPDGAHETPIAVRTTSRALIPTKGATKPPAP